MKGIDRFPVLQDIFTKKSLPSVRISFGVSCRHRYGPHLRTISELLDMAFNEETLLQALGQSSVQDVRITAPFADHGSIRL